MCREKESRSHKNKESKHEHHHKHKSSRTHHHHHHHHSTRHHHNNGHDTTTDTRPERTVHKKPKESKRLEPSRRDEDRDRNGGRYGPSSSVGPGRVEPVLLIIIILLGISAVALFSLSIWLFATRNGWPSGLNQTGSITWTRFISYATAALIVAFLIIPIIIISIAASVTRSGSSARKLRLALIFFTTAAIVILIMMTVTGLLFATNGPQFIANTLEQSWKNTVASGNFRVACHIQNVNKCFGWEDNSCVGCRPLVSGDYTGCTTEQQEICPRCFEQSSTKSNGNNKKPANASHVAVILPHQSTRVGLEHRRRKAQVAKLASTNQRKFSIDKMKRTRRQDAEDYEFGCFRYIIWRNREFFIPLSVYTIFLVFLLTLLQWKACIDSSSR